MRVLVTGGAGFLGSHLCKKLLDDGAEVICLDNFHTGTVNNIVGFGGHAHFKQIKHDVISPFDIEAEQIFNLACPASPVKYQEDPVRTIKTSVQGAINTLDLATKHDARILQASTSEVYGDPEVHPQLEDYRGKVNPTGLRACYDEGKRCAETLFFDYHRQKKTDIKVVRIFNTYGPKMTPNDGRVISNFIVQAMLGADITVYGDGTQTRSFCYVDDLIEAMGRMMATRKEFVGPVNIGNPIEYEIRQIAEIILKLVGGKSKLVFKKLPEDDPLQRCPDITLAKKELSWEPKVSLEDGLNETIAYFRKFI